MKTATYYCIFSYNYGQRFVRLHIKERVVLRAHRVAILSSPCFSSERNTRHHRIEQWQPDSPLARAHLSPPLLLLLHYTPTCRCCLDARRSSTT